MQEKRLRKCIKVEEREKREERREGWRKDAETDFHKDLRKGKTRVDSQRSNHN